MKTKEELAEEWLSDSNNFHGNDFGESRGSARDLGLNAYKAGYEAGQPKWVSCKDKLPNNSVICLIAYLDIDNELETFLASAFQESIVL